MPVNEEKKFLENISPSPHGSVTHLKSVSAPDSLESNELTVAFILGKKLRIA